MATIGPIQNLYNLRMAGALPPAQGGGLSAMPNIDQPMPAPQSADPIQSGIDTLMAYGRQATGQKAGFAKTDNQPITMAGGGLLSTPFYQQVMELSPYPYYESATRPYTSPTTSYMPVSTTDLIPTTMKTDLGSSLISPVSQSEKYLYDESGDGFGMFTSETAPKTAEELTFQKGLTSALTDPVLSSTLGLSPTDARNIGRASTAANVVGGLSGIPGLSTLGKIGGVATFSPMDALATAAGFVNPIVGAGIAGLGFLMENLPEAEVNALGQVAQYGWGNQAVDKYGNPRGSYEETVSTAADKAAAAQAAENAFYAVDPGYLDAPSYDGRDFEGAGYDGAYDASAYEGGDDSGWAQGGPINFYAQESDSSVQPFEGMVQGQGTGMSDNVPFSIEGQQPALLSRDEYVIPADVVSQLGDGSSGAGADMLDSFVSQVRHNKYGHTKQPPQNGGGLMGVLQSATGGSLMKY